MSTEGKISRPTLMRNVNKSLRAVNTTNDYKFEAIPMDQIMEIVGRFGGMLVDEAGEQWQGIFCGENGHCTIKVVGEGFGRNCGVSISWHKMQSGKYEIVCYIS